MEPVITIELNLEQASALTKAVGKSLASEQSKLTRNGKGHPATKAAAREWQLLDSVDQQLREQMSDALDSFQ